MILNISGEIEASIRKQFAIVAHDVMINSANDACILLRLY